MPPGTPNELEKNFKRLQAQFQVEKEAREAAEAAKDAAELALQKKTKEAEKLAKLKAENEAAEAAALEQHRRATKPQAEEIIAKLEALVKGEQLPGLSDEFKQVQTDILTNPAPISQEAKAVTVACMRKIAKTEQELDAAKTELATLKAERRVALEMTNVDDAERGERREVKAGRRLMADAGDEDTADEQIQRPRTLVPWIGQLTGQKVGGIYVPPSQRTYAADPVYAAPAAPAQERSVQAGRGLTRQAPAPAVARDQYETTEQTQQQQRRPSARQFPLTRYGAPPTTNYAGAINDEFYAHMEEVMGSTPLDKAMWHLAGHDLTGPSANERRGY
jgi:hypothetical protein